MLESRTISNPKVKLSDLASEGCLSCFLDTDNILEAGALRWDYGKASDLRSRPTVGVMENEDEAREYFEKTYNLKYGTAQG